MATILIIDDSPSMRHMIKFVLSQAGHEIVEAEDGVDALDKIDQQKTDAVICDYNMPNMNGPETVENIRAQSKYQKIPILMLTTESDQEKKEQGKLAGATGWIVKPFNPKSLVGIIDKVLGKSQ